MKLFKKVLYFALPLSLIVIFALTFMPSHKNTQRYDIFQNNNFSGRTEYNGQVAYADTPSQVANTSESEKGGAYYLGKNSQFTFNGGTLSNKFNTYGGAVYVSDGATFTMNAGTISNCSANYGGAIYVASGGTCRILGGIIEDNFAQVAPAIYVEYGGVLEVSDSVIIRGNIVKYPLPEISQQKTLIGGSIPSYGTSSLGYQTIKFGLYPQDCVMSDLNTELETWFQEENPPEVADFSVVHNSAVLEKVKHPWKAYRYTDGNIYCRGEIYKYIDNGNMSVVRFRTPIEVRDGSIEWFKCEPINWIIFKKDSEHLYCVSEAAIMAGMPYSMARGPASWTNGCFVRNWLNTVFYEQAFSVGEKTLISVYTNSSYVRLLSKAEVEAFNSATYAPERLCAPTDFCLANYGRIMTDENESADLYAYYRYNYKYDQSNYSRQLGTIPYMLVDEADGLYWAYKVDYDSRIQTYQMTDAYLGIRPVIVINL